jgi:predicted DNA-binding protein with PD1-like motif
MKSRKVAGGFLVLLEAGDEVLSSLSALVSKKKIPCGFIQGIGAIKNSELCYFDTKSKKYRVKKVKSTVEVLSLTGNISHLERKPFIHVHATVAGPGQKIMGGHLFKATVAVTLEIFIQVISRRLNRKYDPKIGFNFWDL